MGLKVADKNGKLVPVHMGSYGIGVSRVMAAVIEAFHDEKGIIWPESIAPFKVGLVNVRAKDESCREKCEELFEVLQNANIDVLYDDRDAGAGTKFSDMELIGVPYVLVVGPKGLEKGTVELKNRKTGVGQEISFEDALEIIKG